MTRSKNWHLTRTYRRSGCRTTRRNTWWRLKKKSKKKGKARFLWSNQTFLRCSVWNNQYLWSPQSPLSARLHRYLALWTILVVVLLFPWRIVVSCDWWSCIFLFPLTELLRLPGFPFHFTTFSLTEVLCFLPTKTNISTPLPKPNESSVYIHILILLHISKESSNHPFTHHPHPPHLNMKKNPNTTTMTSNDHIPIWTFASKHVHLAIPKNQPYSEKHGIAMDLRCASKYKGWHAWKCSI